jgi:hypothetical protein
MHHKNYEEPERLRFFLYAEGFRCGQLHLVGFRAAKPVVDQQIRNKVLTALI